MRRTKIRGCPPTKGRGFFGFLSKSSGRRPSKQSLGPPCTRAQGCDGKCAVPICNGKSCERYIGNVLIIASSSKPNFASTDRLVGRKGALRDTGIQAGRDAESIVHAAGCPVLDQLRHAEPGGPSLCSSSRHGGIDRCAKLDRIGRQGALRCAVGFQGFAR